MWPPPLLAVIIAVAVLLAFAVVWNIVTLIMSIGWRSFSQVFPYPKQRTLPTQSVHLLQYLSMMGGVMGYKTCVYLTFTVEGLVLKTNILFRLGHAPIFIPWQRITSIVEWKPLIPLSSYRLVTLDTNQTFIVGGQAALVLEVTYQKYHPTQG